ncbi:MAG: hypothetical protein NPIRA05_21840 [Nitrospirales bacterium]|nr:MAG: hypothetical protein NPIRA05_21840 [Nitrospirales bacterium]
MRPLKVYLDEDVHHLIAHALILRGWETHTTIEAGLSGTSDLQQIQFATKNSYAIISYNSSDFPRLHYEILNTGNHHSGIIVATQDNPRNNVKALLSLLNTFSAEDLVDQLVYLNNWI